MPYKYSIIVNNYNLYKYVQVVCCCTPLELLFFLLLFRDKMNIKNFIVQYNYTINFSLDILNFLEDNKLASKL